jgi:hypothetical protein
MKLVLVATIYAPAVTPENRRAKDCPSFLAAKPDTLPCLDLSCDVKVAQRSFPGNLQILPPTATKIQPKEQDTDNHPVYGNRRCRIR